MVEEQCLSTAAVGREGLAEPVFAEDVAASTRVRKACMTASR